MPQVLSVCVCVCMCVCRDATNRQLREQIAGLERQVTDAVNADVSQVAATGDAVATKLKEMHEAELQRCVTACSYADFASIAHTRLLACQCGCYPGYRLFLCHPFVFGSPTVYTLWSLRTAHQAIVVTECFFYAGIGWLLTSYV